MPAIGGKLNNENGGESQIIVSGSANDHTAYLCRHLGYHQWRRGFSAGHLWLSNEKLAQLWLAGISGGSEGLCV